MLHKLLKQKFNLDKRCEKVGGSSQTVGVARI